jgi:hypothetical protein
MPVLTAIDVLKVQPFIFASNRLRDVVTGSWLVHWSTSRDGTLKDFVSRESLLMVGGGNAIIEFKSWEEARRFAACYTRRLYDKAPGLEVVVVHKAYDSGGLVRALQEIQVELARVKAERIPASPLLGLSVTAACRESGLPAVGFDNKEPAIPLSWEVLSRREKAGEAEKRWEDFLSQCPGFAFPMELDQLGRTYGDTSLIGVVHVDGNGVGKKIKSWLDKKAESGAEDEVVRSECREWSEAINKLGNEVFQGVVDRVYCAARKDLNNGQEVMKITGKPARLSFELSKEKGEWLLPLRPILLGGDDLTFVCDGRIALDLAEVAVSQFGKSDIPHLGNICACAGVATVPAHTPFMRSYALAENLCSSAKQMLKMKGDEGCALDWHIGTSRYGEVLDKARSQYQMKDRLLTCRPYRLGSDAGDEESWRWLSGTLLEDPERGLRGSHWSQGRNKVKALAEIIREGPEGVSAAFRSWKIAAQQLNLPKPIEEDGFFAKNRTPLLDAVELLDLHFILDPTSSAGRNDLEGRA